MMFSSSSTSANIALEVESPSIAGSEDGFDDDATEFSMQPSLFNTTSQLSPGGTNNNRGGNIRLEGWLYHTTSSYKDNTTTTSSNSTTVAPPPTSSSSSYISKTVSKKRKKRSNTKQRYFVLRGSTISYYARRHDIKAKGTYVLTQGCTVGPVVYSSLDDSAQAAASVATATENNQQQQQNEGSVPPSPAANNNVDTPPAKSSSKKQKKQRQFYCVQVTWPTNNKPSKDEKFIAQAKAQVAAESEKEALQQQKLELDTSFDENRVSLDPRISNTGGSRSPIMRPKQLMRRSKSENQQSSSSGSPSKVPARRSNSDDLPPELSAPNLSSEDEQQTSSSLLPVSELKETAPLTTPAMALAGSVALPKLHSSEKASVENNNNTDKLNHETGLHKHYKHQIEKHTRDQEKSAAELQKVQQLISKKESHQKTKRRVIQGTKVAAVSTVAITTGVLTAGIGLAAGLVFVGITAAAGGSGAVVGSKVLDKARGKYNAHQSQKSFHLIIGASTYEEAVQWKMAMEHVIKELADEAAEDTSDEQWRIAQVLSGENDTESPSAPLSPPRSPRNGTAKGMMTTTNDNNRENMMYHDMTPKWVPIQGGGMALWGILGALGGGGGNLRIYREERSPNAPFQQQQSYMSTLSTSSPYWLFTQPQTSAFPTIPRFRSDVGLAGQPFPPFKASISLKANSLDAFMCLMCSGRIQNDTVNDGIPVPNSGQIASFRIIETMDDHMDVIHLVFRPLYLFPSWTAPRDFVLYRFWKYDDDGTYQICFDSCEHRDCPAIMGYQRGEMHSVYTIAPLKRKKKKKRGTSASAVPSDISSAADSNQECLLSHVIQIDPRGWVPTTASLPFVRSQGYGDAFTIMGLLQMLDVKEALDTARFAIPQSSNRPPVRLNKGKAGLVRNRSGGGGRQQQQQMYMSSLERNESVDMSDDEADYDMYSSHYSGDGYHQSPPLVSSTTDNVVNTNSGAADESKQEGTTSSSNNGRALDLSSISSIPSPTISDWWDEPDANSFRVRGKTYKTDNKKVNAGRSLFRLFATDIVEVDVPIMTGMCLHPNERVQLALQREREKAENGDSTSSTTEMPPFVFAVNINMPGPPHYHMVFYYAVDDMSMIDGSDGTPSSQLCQEFFFGKDDTFRDNTFKLIPHIVEGNFMVRKAVGSTPAIMGNKIKQTYVQGERFFELIIDTGSSSVAAGVIRICNGYAKMIVVDLAFLFEGYDERTLPEKVLGCIRLKNVEFGKKLRFCEAPL